MAATTQKTPAEAVPSKKMTRSSTAARQPPAAQATADVSKRITRSATRQLPHTPTAQAMPMAAPLAEEDSHQRLV